MNKRCLRLVFLMMISGALIIFNMRSPSIQQYVYHCKPVNMEGNIIYPLSQLQNVKPEIFDKVCAKYKGREHLMKMRIPLLDCYWNDAVFCTPIHPHKIYQALREADVPVNHNTEFYKVPAEKLENIPTVYWFFSKEQKDYTPETYEKDFE